MVVVVVVVHDWWLMVGTVEGRRCQCSKSWLMTVKKDNDHDKQWPSS